MALIELKAHKCFVAAICLIKQQKGVNDQFEYKICIFNSTAFMLQQQAVQKLTTTKYFYTFYAIRVSDLTINM